MLTSIYYYNYYRPYILKPRYEEVKTKKIEKTPTAEKNNDTENDAYSLYLNKSAKTDVVTYAKDVYTNVISLKNSTKNINRDISEYKNYIEADDYYYNHFVNALDEDLQNFKDDYNRAYKFSAYQKHSKNLTEYSDDLKQIVNYYSSELNQLGLHEDDAGYLYYDNSEMQKYLQPENKAAMAETLDRSSLLFKTVYSLTKDQLTNPMAEHMNFKGLSYYYNYKYDKVNIDTFQLIKTGLLVDYAL